ncbi:hypothetical protein GCM10011415_29360 [Salipiger pallidus]|uniref:Uncharacterized protein n=1 Tax=Salipiger pallidus TaxID=1775170 RepID=A0A8J2ZL75_9RHOB|nr:hypothetical protein GCM10011415_29360 [Salipiger pallidus]
MMMDPLWPPRGGLLHFWGDPSRKTQRHDRPPPLPWRHWWLVSLATFSPPLTALEAMKLSQGLCSGEQARVMSAMPAGC